jgi:hypothetical protein
MRRPTTRQTREAIEAVNPDDASVGCGRCGTFGLTTR